MGILDFFAMRYGDVHSHNEEHKDFPFQHSSSLVFACLIQQAIYVEFENTSANTLCFTDQNLTRSFKNNLRNGRYVLKAKPRLDYHMAGATS